MWGTVESQTTTSLLPNVDQSEMGARFPKPWPLAFLVGVRPQRRMATPAKGQQALPFPRGANAEDGLQEDTTQDLTLWQKGPPVLKPQERSMGLCPQGGQDQAAMPISICSVSGRPASTFRHAPANNPHAVLPEQDYYPHFYRQRN